MNGKVEIVEVGARDGLQNEAAVLEPAVRLAFIARLEASGVKRAEVASFVNPARVPQMAGGETIMAGLAPRDGHRRIGLALNRRGWDRARAAHCDEVNVVVCATDGFGIRNQGASRREQMDALGVIVADQKLAGGQRAYRFSEYLIRRPGFQEIHDRIHRGELGQGIRA